MSLTGSPSRGAVGPSRPAIRRCHLEAQHHCQTVVFAAAVDGSPLQRTVSPRKVRDCCCAPSVLKIADMGGRTSYPPPILPSHGLPTQRCDRRRVGGGEAALAEKLGVLADQLEAGADGAAAEEALVHVLQDDAELEVGEDGVEVELREVGTA